MNTQPYQQVLNGKSKNKKKAIKPAVNNLPYPIMEDIPCEQKYEKTKIYKSCLKLLTNISKINSIMPKTFKYDLGSKILDSSSMTMFYAILAYEEQVTETKLQFLVNCKTYSMQALVWLRVLNNCNCISNLNFIECSGLLVDIKMQCENWIDSLLNPKQDNGGENK